MRLINADALEKDGWRMNRNVQINKQTMEFQTRKPTDFPTIEPEPEQRWIPCSERLPDIKEHHCSEPCIVYCENGACGARINRCCDCLTDVYFGNRPCSFRKPDPKDFLTADELVCLKLYEQCLTTYKIAEEMHCTRGKVQSMVKELIRRGVTQKRDRLWLHS